MSALRIAVVGAGKMGRAVAELAPERGIAVVAVVGANENVGGQGLTRDRLGDADVIVEFTEPAEAPSNILAAARAGYAVVSGTTGWSDRSAEVERGVLAAGGALVHAPNFSVGVNLFLAIAEAAARVMRAAPEFDPHIVETHHAAKKDAPSGTALALERAVRPGLGRGTDITSVRTGHVPGTHELTFDGPFEQIRLGHMARDRRVFADGALRAAEWVRGRQGVFTMRDVLDLEPETA
jgi:4-hydroxy-tetrahydrodipicolinate reductase